MENERVFPWNWEDVIDKDKSAEAFIRRMTGACTYLQGEPVLPRCSLLYERFCVLNELNGAQWSTDGDDFRRFSADFRFGIYDDLFERGSVTYKKVEDWLSQHGNPGARVKGGQGETKFESKLGSHIFFTKLLGVDELTGSQVEMIEKIILWNTLFEDRDILKERISKEYGDVLSNDQIKRICKKRFSGWGRLSKKFLCELKTDTPEGSKSIMDILVEGDPAGKHIGSAMVLMEILHDETLGFEKRIDEFNKSRAESEGGLKIEDLPGSPALRRSVNQAQRIVREIAGIAGKAPANIYIEVTREDDPRKKGIRTRRRYDNIKEALKNLKAEGKECLKEINGFDVKEFDDDAVALYFMQNGKCLYCGEALDIHGVLHGGNSCQIDHIIPRAWIKDDSFDNRALVHSHCNQRKADDLLLDASIRKRMAHMWRDLHDAGLISDKKFINLMRSRISDRQAEGFINRQLVETSQIVKSVRLILEEEYPETNIRSIKAALSSQLREAKGYVKCREINDYHHAHDALLACELGRFIELRFGGIFDNPIVMQKAMRNYVREMGEEYARSRRMPGSPSFIVGSFTHDYADRDTGEFLWDADVECERIRTYLNYKDCFISHMPEITSGAFWDATIYSPKGSNKKLGLPLKQGLDPDTYGSYSSEKFAWFIVYEIQKRGGASIEFSPVPVSIAQKAQANPDVLTDYAKALAADDGASLLRIIRPVVYKYQLIELNGDRLYITGQKEVRNANEIAFSQEETCLWRKIVQGLPVDSERLDALYESICAFCDARARRSGRALRLDERAEAFARLADAEKADVLLEILRNVTSKSRVANLLSIGGTKYSGVLAISFSKELNDRANESVIIDQSVTGMFEKRQRIGL